MSAIDNQFAKLRAAQRKAFIPFVTAGDPDLEFTQLLLAELDQAGASICEVGVPYSDPIADGPIIQASYTRALQSGFDVEAMFKMLHHDSPVPRVTMVSFSIVHRFGLSRYLDAAVQAGVAGLIIPDLPVEESPAVFAECSARELSLIQLVTPTSVAARAESIVEYSTGFIYCVSVTGITGERTSVPEDLVQRIEWLRARADTPVCVGFGISSPEHVRQVAPIADGVIVGSAFVRRIAEVTRVGRPAALQQIRKFAEEMVQATMT